MKQEASRQDEFKNKSKKTKEKLREEMQALRQAIMTDVEPIIDLRAHMVVGSLFASSKQPSIFNQHSSVMKSGQSSQILI